MNTSSNALQRCRRMMLTSVTALTLALLGTSCDHLGDPHDHSGENNPNRIDTLFLKPGAIYLGSVQFENRAKSPVENITEEVLEDADEHQVFYTVSNSLGQVTVLDKDGRGLPLGLTFSIATTTAAAAVPGSLTLSLYHYESESAKNGTDLADETDVEVTFPLIVR
jgi:hypothetical protein